MRLAAISIAACLALAPAGAIARDSTRINRPVNTEIFSFVGDPMIRVNLRESLPNAFGGADIFGRTRDRGYVEITFAGIRDGRAVFWRRSVGMVSTESTLSRSGSDSFSGTATTFGNTTTYSGTVSHAPQATVTTLPPDTIEVAIELSQNHIITVEDRVINVLSADAAGVRFVVTLARNH